MNNIYLIDIDGCITDGKNKPVDMVHFAKLQKTLNSIVGSYHLCTGRSATYVESIAQFLNLNGWCICENGAYIYHTKTDEIIINPLMASNFKSSLESAIKEINFSLGNEATFELGKELSLSINPNKMTIFELYNRVYDCVGMNYDCFNIDYSTTAVDITSKGVNKKTGLDVLKGVVEFNTNSTIIGIGDSSGDLPFLMECDLVGCPSNAIDKVKEISHYVSKYKSTRGVMDIIQSH